MITISKCKKLGELGVIPLPGYSQGTRDMGGPGGGTIDGLDKQVM